MPLSDYDRLFNTIEELVMHHSPSGAEAEINQLLISRFAALGVEVWQDRADNVIAKIPGRDSNSAIAITQREFAGCLGAGTPPMTHPSHRPQG